MYLAVWVFHELRGGEVIILGDFPIFAEGLVCFRRGELEVLNYTIEGVGVVWKVLTSVQQIVVAYTVLSMKLKKNWLEVLTIVSLMLVYHTKYCKSVSQLLSVAFLTDHAQALKQLVGSHPDMPL